MYITLTFWKRIKAKRKKKNYLAKIKDRISSLTKNKATDIEKKNIYIYIRKEIYKRKKERNKAKKKKNCRFEGGWEK